MSASRLFPHPYWSSLNRVRKRWRPHPFEADCNGVNMMHEQQTVGYNRFLTFEASEVCI